jgi:LacI family transcriptional regulator
MKTANGARDPVGIKRIAQEAQVSIATVSRVLNGIGRVSEALQTRVNEAVERLGYRPNLVARNLRTRRTFTIGVILPNIGNPHFSDAVRAMQDAAVDAGYTVLVVNSDGDPDQESTAIRTLLSRQVDGLVLVSTSVSATPALRSMVDNGTPVLAMDRAIRGLEVDQVLIDIRAGTRGAVMHLAERGRRRIAFIAGPPRMWTASEKLRGYREGLRRVGLKFDSSLVFPGDYTQPSGEAQALALLEHRPRADAVIIANNLMTLGAMRVLLRHSISIPKDLALVGYDNVPWTDVVRPAVTVVAQPAYELGRRSILALLARVGDATGKPQNVRLDAELIVRESTAASG